MTMPYFSPSPIAAVLCLLMLVGGCSTAQASPLVVVEAEPSQAIADRDDASPALRIVEPADGATLTSPVRFVVELDSFSLAPKGRVRDGEGHLHVLVNQDCIEQGAVIPSDDDHIHVGTGSNSVEVELAPGQHQVCVQIGDGFHSAVNLSAQLSLFVEG